MLLTPPVISFFWPARDLDRVSMSVRFDKRVYFLWEEGRLDLQKAFFRLFVHCLHFTFYISFKFHSELFVT